MTEMAARDDQRADVAVLWGLMRIKAAHEL